MANLGIFKVFVILASISLASVDAQSVTLCSLYLALQNRCPTPSTTIASQTTSTMRTTPVTGANDTSSDGATESGESEVTDACGLQTITFCPAMEVFLNGGRRCTNGQTVQVSLTTLGQLLVDPSGQNAEVTAGSGNADSLANALASVSKTIQGTSTQATVGVTFIPVGQLIG